jgi:hypothetical protein
MNECSMRHRLAAILAADAAGYARLMAADDRAALEALDAARSVFRTRSNPLKVASSTPPAIPCSRCSAVQAVR